ncbi:MAG TPA: helix-turn-helix domain-containing protein [Candidatus Paceibacterota bacterium]|nr:helix-turn-helix domain-containing protein [Candidatus Paceibacterota bacterium]
MYKKHTTEDKLINETLIGAANQFKGNDAVHSFIKKVLTERERQEIGRRLAVARLILAGATYYEVCEKLHISPNTFRNIRRWVSDELPDYNNILDENKAVRIQRDKKRVRSSYQRISPFSFEDLKRRYPMHFFLFNLADELLTLKENKPNSKQENIK